MVIDNYIIQLKSISQLIPYFPFFYLFYLFSLISYLFEQIAKTWRLMRQVCYRFFKVFDKTIVAIVSCASVIIFV